MPEIIVASPLTHTYISRQYDFPSGISVRPLNPILWDRAVVKRFISEAEREELAGTAFWLCVAKEFEQPYDRGDELYEMCRRAMYALQIICPSHRKNAYLKFQSTDGGFDNIGSEHPKEMNATLMGRLIRLEGQNFAQDFGRVYQGVERAFQEKIVRLQNPVILLEHGLQLGNPVLSTLFFVMGLDMLFMAGESATFVGRVNGFLGPTTLVFPPTFHDHQPKYQVQEVVGDLFQFRSLIAHGREIPKSPFREKCDLWDLNNQRINQRDYFYAELLCESALFLLCQSLRKIFVVGIVDEVKDEGRWKQRLKIGAKLSSRRNN